MAVKGITALTLADWGKRIDPNGKVDKIIELLSQTNPILQDMLIVEGNLPTGHRTTIRSGLPSATGACSTTAFSRANRPLCRLPMALACWKPMRRLINLWQI